MSNLLSSSLLFTALGASIAAPSLDEGQGTARPGSTSFELQPGNLIYGAPFDATDALGKVVIVEMGGS